MICARELDHQLSPSRRAREAQSGHRRLCPGAGEPCHLRARDSGHHLLGKLDLRLGGRPVARAAQARRHHRLHHHGVSVTQNQGTPGADVVQIAVAVDVHEVGSARARDEDRIPADEAHRPHGAVHAPGQELLRPPEQLGRSGAAGYGVCVSSHSA